LSVKFDRNVDGVSASAKILVDGVMVGEVNIEKILQLWISYNEGIDIGEDRITAVSEKYEPKTSKFSGYIEEVKFIIK
jgi:hypothetical protein